MAGRAVEPHGAATFMIAALGVGIIVGLASALLVGGISLVSDGAEAMRDDVSLRRWAALVMVPLGMLVSWLISKRWGPGVEGGGVTETMVGLSLHSGYLPTRTVAAKIAATAATLGAGGSAGREGPMVHIGGTIGSSIARYTRFGEDQIRSLVVAGAGAGIGASFNAPIAGMLFALEVLLGNFAIRHLNAVVIASVAASVTTRSLVGEERILSAPSHSLADPRELLVYVMVGLLAVVFGVLFLRVLDRIEGSRLPRRFPRWLRPLGAGLVVGTIGVIEPRLLGTGQEFLGSLLRLGNENTELWWALLLLAAWKTVAATFTRAGGGSGGTFMPSLFIGGAVGAALAILVAPVWGWSELDPGSFAVVGMAATFAAVARAPLTSIIIVFEITGDYGLVLPLMLATSLATFLGDRFHPTSGYHLPLRRKGINLIRREDIDLLDTVTVGEVMSTASMMLHPAMSVTEASQLLASSGHHGLPVTSQGELVGLVTLTDLANARPDDSLADESIGEGGDADAPPLEIDRIMTRSPITVIPSMPVSVALARMAALGIGRMPVVSDKNPRQLVGMFRRESVVHAYHHALGAATGRHLYRDRLRQRTLPGANFFEVPIPYGSAVSGQPVATVPWPEDATLVSVRRGASVLIPHGDTILRTNDTITAFGTGEARVELAMVLEPPPPSATDDEYQ